MVLSDWPQFSHARTHKSYLNLRNPIDNICKNEKCLTFLANRALAQLAQKAGVPVKKVKNVIIWGNHSSTQYPDAAHAIIDGHKAPEVRQTDRWTAIL